MDTSAGDSGVVDGSGSFSQGGITGMDPTGGPGDAEPAPELALATTTAFTGPVTDEFTMNAVAGIALSNANLILDSQNTSALIDVTAVTAVSGANGITAPATSTGNAVGTAFNFSGTPTAAATTSFDVTLDDGTITKTWRVTFVVAATGTAPTITSTAPTTVTGPTLYSYTITATGAPSPTFSVSGNPGWLTLTGDVLSGTPTADGTYGPITITATNGVAPDDTEIFSIGVTGISTAPTITSTAPTTVTGATLYTYTIIATGSPAPTFSVSGEPGWLTLTGNVLSGTPTADGTYGPITITATNGVAPDDTEVFSIVVSGIGGGGGGGGGGDGDGGGGCATSTTNSSWMLLLAAFGALAAVTAIRRRTS